MSDDIRTWPVMILEDRYGGTYSGGAWLAIARYYESCAEAEGEMSRKAWVEDGAHGGDLEAAEFGEKIAAIPWLAVGGTPNEALQALRDKIFAVTHGMTKDQARQGNSR